MTEYEQLLMAIRYVRQAQRLVHSAYDGHDHEHDLAGGIALSAAKLSTLALEQELTSIIMNTPKDSSNEPKI